MAEAPWFSNAVAPELALYDPEIYHKHHAGQYQAPAAERPHKPIEFPYG